MSNTTDKLAIANIALINNGELQITSLTDTSDMNAVKVNSIFEGVVKELLADDWYFNRKRVELELVYKLTIDSSPSPEAWSVGATLTGATSGAICTVLAVISSTVYWVTEPSTDFTDGETIADDAETPNSLDCASDYPEEDDSAPIFGTYTYAFQYPSDGDILYVRGLGDYDYDRIKYKYDLEGRFILTNEYNAYFHYNYYIQVSEGVSDVTLMPIWFHRLISARIALILSANITQNQKMKTKIELDYDRAYLEAKEKNGVQSYNKYENQGNYDVAEGANEIIDSL